MKTKNKSIATIFGVLASSIILVVMPAQANAEGCSPEDPCSTWAMVDASGVVTNVIVCQPSVCGSGTWAGQRVVPQVAANPVTNTPEGTGAYNSDPTINRVVTESSGTFTIHDNATVVSKEVVVEDNTTTTVEVIVASSAPKTFTYADTVGKSYGQVEMQILDLPVNTAATVSVEEVSIVETTTVKTTMPSRVSAPVAEAAIKKSAVSVKQSSAVARNMARILRMLGRWTL